jgi:hypothetical protein
VAVTWSHHPQSFEYWIYYYKFTHEFLTFQEEKVSMVSVVPKGGHTINPLPLGALNVGFTTITSPMNIHLSEKRKSQQSPIQAIGQSILTDWIVIESNFLGKRSAK